MKPAATVTVFACADRKLRGFSLRPDGSDLPDPADGGRWIAVATIPIVVMELEKYTLNPASVLVNLRERGYDVAPATQKVLPLPTPHRSSA